MGYKLLRDGMDSANFVSMYSVDGQDDLNFFANDFSNHIPHPESLALKPLEVRFATATDWIQTVGLSEMASYTQDGHKEASPVFPWKLRFEVSGEYKFASTVDEGYTDFREDLMSITEGSTLYYIHAWDKPEELGGTETRIGKIMTRSETTTSYWGDEHMYIRHERMDDDLAIKPEWIPYTPKYSPFGLTQLVETAKCPFANLLKFFE